jgi:hypothetical protein
MPDRFQVNAEYHFMRSVLRYALVALVIAAVLRAVVVYAPFGPWLARRGDVAPPHHTARVP